MTFATAGASEQMVTQPGSRSAVISKSRQLHATFATLDSFVGRRNRSDGAGKRSIKPMLSSPARGDSVINMTFTVIRESVISGSCWIQSLISGDACAGMITPADRLQNMADRFATAHAGSRTRFVSVPMLV